MKLSRRRSLHLAAGVVALVCGGANAEDRYPSKPVRIVVSFSAGGPTDTVARVMGAKMAELLGQQFVIENKAGAGGNIGADAVAKAPPDGYRSNPGRDRRPYRGENSGPGKDDRGELDTETRN